MSDGEGGESPAAEEKKFFVDRAKLGRATCRKCKQKLEAGGLRIAKSGYNPFGPGPMKQWHHVACIFEVFGKQRATTARITSPDDIAGWSDLDDDDRTEILSYLPEGAAASAAASSSSSQKTKPPASSASKTAPATPKTSSAKAAPPSAEERAHKDNSFREFRRLCADVANLSAYGDKTAAVRTMITSGSSGESFKGDLLLWVRLLLPGAVKRVYNIQSKQIVKLFSRILHVDQDEMLKDLEEGDVAETVRIFFERSTHLQPTKKSTLSLYDVDEFLEELSKMTKEDEQAHHFKQIAKRCTSNDLKMIIRLVKHDLRINAGPKHILEAVHADAYQAFQTSHDIESVIARVTGKNIVQGKEGPGKKTGSGGLTITLSLMTPVLPMLAEACKSVEQAMKKCPNGMYSEIKYDGERVQVHKKGHEFKYFSRSLKPVMPHKVSHFKDYIPEAFPRGEDVILDSEILMIDTETGKPLPFGTLGRHKKEGLKSANVCLFVFDCMFYNGEVLLSKSMKERRKILHNVMTEIPNRIMFSETEEVYKPKQLEAMIEKVFKLGLEGLVLKDLMSPYEPGKRHWLKVKKDYLFGGAMADSADLVVLGAWFGTGHKGGMMSVFLMGCHDKNRDRWCTVTKVHTGHDDKTLERLQEELADQVVKISREASRVPSWLNCTKTMIPDFVAKDPKTMPVWEITGAEFTRHDVHTADGISIRFPRVTRIRSDKDWKTATSLAELKDLYDKSKDTSDFSLIPGSPKDSPETSIKQSPARVLSVSPSKDSKKEFKKTKIKKEDLIEEEIKSGMSDEGTNMTKKRSRSPNKGDGNKHQEKQTHSKQKKKKKKLSEADSDDESIASSLDCTVSSGSGHKRKFRSSDENDSNGKVDNVAKELADEEKGRESNKRGKCVSKDGSPALASVDAAGDSSTPKKGDDVSTSSKNNRSDSDCNINGSKISLKTFPPQPPQEHWAFATFVSWELNGIDDKVLLSQAKRSIVDTVTRFRVQQEILHKSKAKVVNGSGLNNSEMHNVHGSEVSNEGKFDVPQAEVSNPEIKNLEDHKESVECDDGIVDSDSTTNLPCIEENSSKVPKCNDESEAKENNPADDEKDDDIAQAEMEEKAKEDWEQDSDWESCGDEGRKSNSKHRKSVSSVEATKLDKADENTEGENKQRLNGD